MGIIQGFDEFEKVHGVLLASAGLPPSLYQSLFEKLSADVFDGGSFFQIEPSEWGAQRRLVSTERMGKCESVFLVDHAWSFRLPDARKQLQVTPGLAKRMAALMCIEDESDLGNNEEVEDEEQFSENAECPSVEAVIEKAESTAREKGHNVFWLELDDSGITDASLQTLNLSSRFPDLVGLSLWGNQLESMDVVVHTVAGLPLLRALWLNDTPVDLHECAALKEAILAARPHLEIYNSKLMENYGQWAIGFCAGIFGVELLSETINESHILRDITCLDLSDRNMQILSAKVFNPEELPRLTSLNLRENEFSEESVANLLRTLWSLVSLQSLQVDIPGPFGISAVSIVEALPTLHELNGMSATKILEKENQVLDINLRPRLPVFSLCEPLVERVMSAMWQYILTYRLADEEKLDETPIW